MIPGSQIPLYRSYSLLVPVGVNEKELNTAEMFDSCHIHLFNCSLIHKDCEIPLSNSVLTLFLEKQSPLMEICSYRSHAAALCYYQKLNEKNYTVRTSMNFSFTVFLFFSVGLLTVCDVWTTKCMLNGSYTIDQCLMLNYVSLDINHYCSFMISFNFLTTCIDYIVLIF